MRQLRLAYKWSAAQALGSFQRQPKTLFSMHQVTRCSSPLGFSARLGENKNQVANKRAVENGLERKERNKKKKNSYEIEIIVE